MSQENHSAYKPLTSGLFNYK